MVDTPRTLCADCSLRKDLPGFLGVSHVNGYADSIESGTLFACHTDRHRVCLGAALVGRAELEHPLPGDLPPVYATVEDYRQAHATGRVTNKFLQTQDRWTDTQDHLWRGWWVKAPAGGWHYLMATCEGNDNDSIYLFFEQVEKMFGPLDKV